MKDLKHQLLEQLAASDILEELNRRKLKPPESPPESSKLDQYKLNLITQLSLFVLTVILITLIIYQTS